MQMPLPENSDAPRLYRARPFVTHRISNQEVIASSLDGKSTASLHPSVASLLTSYVAFRTLEEQAQQHWAGATRQARVRLINGCFQFLQASDEPFHWSRNGILDLLKKTLGLLLSKGFLVEVGEFTKIGTVPEGAESKYEKITTIAVLTCDRLSNVERALTSYIENTVTFNKKVEFAVFDDSENRRALEVLRELKKKYGVPLLYSGKEEKKEFIHQLTSRGIPQNVLDFCLFGFEGIKPTMGANRNSFLLHTVGELAFCADDDTICRAFRSPSYRPGVRIGDDPSFIKEIRCYSSFEEATKEVVEENLDLLGLHENALAGLPGIAQRESERNAVVRPNTAKLDGDLMNLIVSGKARVVASVIGSIGDSGASDPTYLYYLDGISRELLLRSEQDFDLAFEKRAQIRTTDQLTIFQAHWMVSMFFGLNNRDLLPPFLPVFRSEDSLFGKLIDACVSGACFAYLPWMISHRPDERQGYHELEGCENHVRPYDLISLLVDDMELKTWRRISTAEKLRILGGYLKKLGSLPIREFGPILKEVKIRNVANALGGFNALLAKYPNPPIFWKNRIEARMSKVSSLLSSLDPYISPSLLERWGAEEGLLIYQKIISIYGQLLSWWPDIVRLTGELKAQGTRMAKEI